MMLQLLRGSWLLILSLAADFPTKNIFSQVLLGTKFRFINFEKSPVFVTLLQQDDALQQNLHQRF